MAETHRLMTRLAIRRKLFEDATVVVHVWCSKKRFVLRLAVAMILPFFWRSGETTSAGFRWVADECCGVERLL